MTAPAGRGLLVLVLVGVALGGCTRAETVNPNLLAPKMVLDVALDGSPLVFVHSAFGERSYDLVEVVLDNATVRSVRDAYSLEERLNVTEAFVEVNARSGETRFGFRGTFAIEPSKERVRVSVLDEVGRWSEPRAYGVPFERILERAPEVKEA